MRKINLIVIHCSATRENEDFTFDDLMRAHKARGFRTVGYHYYIRKDGSVNIGRPITEIGAHVGDLGLNHNSVGICYEGGLKSEGRPNAPSTAKDTRTLEQKSRIIDCINDVLLQLLLDSSTHHDISSIRICGHRDLSPDLNNDGIIESREWVKMCPCFDAETEYKDHIRIVGRGLQMIADYELEIKVKEDASNKTDIS